MFDPRVFVGFIFPSVLILSWFGSSIPSVIYRLLLFMTSMAHFSMPNSVPMSWLYILTACMRVCSSFSFFANNLISSMYIRWLIFSCDLLRLYPTPHFLSMWFSGIMAIMNSKGDSASPWKMPLWIFVSAMLLPPVVSSSLQVFMVSSMKFMTSCDICTFWDSVVSSFVDHIICLFLVNPGHS